MKKLTRRARPSLYPLPPVLVSCQHEGPANIITLAWAGVVCSDPVTISLGIRPERHSYDIIRKSGEFVINMPMASQVELVDRCGMISGSKYDKFKECAFTGVPGEQVQVPLIEECPLNMECKVTQVVPLGSHDLFLGEVMLIHYREEFMVNGRFDLSLADPLAFGFGRYYRLGERLARHGESVLRKR